MLQKTVNKLEEQNQELVKQAQQKDERICELEQMLLNAQRALYGQRSEKRVYVLDDENEQLSMFGQEEPSADTSEAQGKKSGETPDDNGEIEVSAHTRRLRRTLEELCRNLPVEERNRSFGRGEGQREREAPDLHRHRTHTDGDRG